MNEATGEYMGNQPSPSRDESGSAIAKLAQDERNAGNWEAALQYYLEASAAAESAGDPLTLAQRLADIGDVLQRAGKPVEAEPYLEEALLIYTSRKDAPRAELAMAVRRLARLWAELGYEGAAQLMREAELSTGLDPSRALPPG